MKKIIIVIIAICNTLLYSNELTDLLDHNSFANELYHYIPKNCVEVLYTKNRENIKNYYTDIEKMRYYHEAYDKFIDWYEQDCYRNLFISLYDKNGYDVLNIGNDEPYSIHELSFLIEDYKKNNNLWFLTCHEVYNTKVTKQNNQCFTKWPLENDECVIILKIDVDYIDIYINDLEHYYDTYCRVYYKLLDEYNYLIKNNKCNLKDLKWPCHADGSYLFCLQRMDFSRSTIPQIIHLKFCTLFFKVFIPTLKNH